MQEPIIEEPLSKAPLGKKSTYVSIYSPSLLFPISRKIKRDEIQIPEKLPFTGIDFWTGFELSWLNPKGKPVVAIAEFMIPCESPHIIESKSFKLYLNSFNNTKFECFEDVQSTLKKDVSLAVGQKISVKLFPLSQFPTKAQEFDGLCLDSLDLKCTDYQPNKSYLFCESDVGDEILFTNLLKSNCLVTGQPDWGSIQIKYRGKKINHEGLLQYIISLRDHNEFHEQCVERIFFDILRNCNPEYLFVFARYTRRGGLDINPLRTTNPLDLKNIPDYRLIRQ